MKGPFDNISELQKSRILKMLGVHRYSYNENQEIIPTIKSEEIVGIITKRQC